MPSLFCREHSCMKTTCKSANIHKTANLTLKLIFENGFYLYVQNTNCINVHVIDWCSIFMWLIKKIVLSLLLHATTKNSNNNRGVLLIFLIRFFFISKMKSSDILNTSGSHWKSKYAFFLSNKVNNHSIQLKCHSYPRIYTQACLYFEFNLRLDNWKATGRVKKLRCIHTLSFFISVSIPWWYLFILGTCENG